MQLKSMKSSKVKSGHHRRKVKNRLNCGGSTTSFLSSRPFPLLQFNPFRQLSRFRNVVLQLNFQHYVHQRAEGFFGNKGDASL
jgi:hypothetical protein